MNKIILITGASGIGKTTIAKYLAEKYQVFHFDDIGVPNVDEMISKYGSPEKWQEVATKAWIEKLRKLPGNGIIILEGSFNPEFASQYHKLICLYIDRSIREKRLIKYRNQPELINQNMENFACLLKEKTTILGGVIIDFSKDLLDTIKKCFDEIEGHIC